ncbi:MAG TPA: hypothetical protein VFG81_16620 [Anaerolineales bacterium]|nr:hypothetical protein [Anaerolineales bacterium]
MSPGFPFTDDCRRRWGSSPRFSQSRRVMYGREVIFLVGGGLRSLRSHAEDLLANCSYVRKLVTQV